MITSDIPPVNLPCEKCEGRLSDWEGMFRDRLFIPYWEDDLAKPVRDFEYHEELRQFVISVSWRIGVTKLGQLSSAVAERLRPALEGWCLYLNGECDNPGPGDHHVYVMDVGELMQIYTPGQPLITNRILQLFTPALGVIDDEDGTYVYANLAGFFMVSLVEPASTAGWSGTKLEKQGVLRPYEQRGPRLLKRRWDDAIAAAERALKDASTSITLDQYFRQRAQWKRSIARKLQGGGKEVDARRQVTDAIRRSIARLRAAAEQTNDPEDWLKLGMALWNAPLPDDDGQAVYAFGKAASGGLAAGHFMRGVGLSQWPARKADACVELREAAQAGYPGAERFLLELCPDELDSADRRA